MTLPACKFYHVKLIILTHAHFDHAENAAQISNALGVPRDTSVSAMAETEFSVLSKKICCICNKKSSGVRITYCRLILLF